MNMTLSEIVALSSVVISIGTNVALYIHLSSTVNARFDASERRIDARFDASDRRIDARFDSLEHRLEMIQGDTHNMDIRITRLEH